MGMALLSKREERSLEHGKSIGDDHQLSDASKQKKQKIAKHFSRNKMMSFVKILLQQA